MVAATSLEQVRGTPILMVDDRRENLQALEAMLEDLGAELVKAQSGAEALRSLLRREFAVVLLDIQMPGMDGFEVAELIRQRDRTRHTPILFVTAFARTDEKVLRAYSLGAVDVVFKPIVPEILRAKVKVFVDLFSKTQALRHANGELEKFAHIVAHDLKEPMRTVSSFMSLFLDDYGDQLDENATRWVNHAVGGTRRMQRLLDDLLAYSRLGREGTSFETVDMGALFEDVEADLDAAIREAGADVGCGELPSVFGSRPQLSRLLQNLVANALKFRGKRPPRVRVSSQREGAWWHFTVEDNGIGFEMKYAERIFGIFQRLHTRAAYPGTGAGLALCRKIVELHAGRIWAESTPDEGAIFQFTLPAGG